MHTWEENLQAFLASAGSIPTGKQSAPFENFSPPPAVETAFGLGCSLNAIRDSEAGVKGLRFQALYVLGSPHSERNVQSSTANDSDWKGLNGVIQSGADFMLFRKDGMLELDGRATIKAHDGVLIDFVYRGLADLRKCYPDRALDPKQGLPTESGIARLSVHANFEVATGPYLDGEDTSWINKRYNSNKLHGANYARLVRNTYVGIGGLLLENGLPSKIAMTVFRLLPGGHP